MPLTATSSFSPSSSQEENSSVTLVDKKSTLTNRTDSGYLDSPHRELELQSLPPIISTPLTQPKHQNEEDDGSLKLGKEDMGNSHNLPEPSIITTWGRLESISSQFGNNGGQQQQQEVVELKLPNTTYVIGRSSSCDIAFPDNYFLSSRHCTIELHCDNPRWHTDLKVTIQDNKSTNGTYLNNQLLKPYQPTTLNDGDLIYLSNQDYTKDHDGEVICYKYCRANARTLHEKYLLLDPIGKGHYSTVTKAKCRESKKVVAIKLLKKCAPGDHQAQLLQTREINILKKVSHPFIASILDVVEAPMNLGLVLEVAQHGDLFDYYSQGIKLSARQFIWIFYQILSAFRYLHANQIAHRDIKPENVLVYSRTNLLIKITDFGLARFFEGQPHFDSLVGSPSYAAPEVNTFTNTRTYTCACDMWSIGVMMYHALTLTMPFPNTKRAVTEQDALALDLTHLGVISTEIQDLIESLLIFNPADRLTADMALDHPLFTQNLHLLRGLIKYEHQFQPHPDALPTTLKYHPSDVPPPPPPPHHHPA